MEENTQYTRCPQCETAFRVSKKMLSMADGKVRCGACLVVFQATNYLLQPKNESQQNTTLLSSSLAPCHGRSNDKDLSGIVDDELIVELESATLSDEEQLLNGDDVLPDNMEDVSLEDEGVSLEDEGVSLEDAGVSLEDEDVSLEDAGVSLEDEDVSLEDEDVSLEDAGVSLEDVGVSLEDEGVYLEDAGVSLEDEDVSLEDEGVSLEDEDVSLEDEGAFLDQADILLEDIDSPLEDIDISLEGSDISREDSSVLMEGTGISLESSLSLTNDVVRQEKDDLSQIDSELAEGNVDVSEEELALISNNLAEKMKAGEVEPDPLEEFESLVVEEKTSLRFLMIISVIIVFFGFLASQFWSNRQVLAYDSTWKGVTNLLCSFISCDIQPRRDIASIKLRQRVVTPSEEQENQLDIKMLITNGAKFDQPYPVIIMKFSNSLAEQVAEQQFLVRDYFPSKQNELMPAGAEIHIAFSTEQPHPDALGFEFVFN